MAKFAADQAGSSCHIHFSLWRDGKNAFAGDKHAAARSQCSDAFRWFLGGWIAHVPEVMVFYAPTVNSYKRYQSRLVGADAARVEPRQPHGGFPRRRQRAEPAHRVPHPRRRLQPVPRVRGGARLGARRHREQDRAAGRSSAATSTPRRTCRACRTRSADATDRFEKSDVRQARVRRRRGRALRALLPDRAARLRQGRDRLGAAALLRADLDELS